MGDSFIAAVVQAAPIWLNREATVEKACRLIAEAAADGARLIAFPESFIPAFPYGALHQGFEPNRDFFRSLFKQAVEIPSPAVAQLAQAAQQAHAIVVIGLTERSGGSLYNTQVFINEDGELLGHRRKLKPTNTERLFWGQGDGNGLTVYPTSIGRIGGLICGEHNLALARYALQTQAEEIHIASYPDPLMEGRPFSDRIDAAVRHYAAEGQCFVLNATGFISDEIRHAVYSTPELEALATPNNGSGLSGILDPFGQYIAGTLVDKEGILLAEIDREQIIDAKYWFDPPGHSGRADIFQFGVNRSH
ncbi:carbon-nitrogen hydrolase family protein [Phormidium tenue FACHB-886]|nr:carbon-nitrogen hydrolase family protein [Phormidium tenue FACHB-886]